MAIPINCTYPNDYSAIHHMTGFFLQVSNATSSVYSGFYLNTPNISTVSQAQLTPTRNNLLWLSGADAQDCNRADGLAQVIENSLGGNEYGYRIAPGSNGRAAVQTWQLSESDETQSIEWSAWITNAFYVENFSEPFTLNIPNAGGYYGKFVLPKGDLN